MRARVFAPAPPMVQRKELWANQYECPKPFANMMALIVQEWFLQQQLDRRLFQCMPDVQLRKIVGDMHLSPDFWTVAVTPPPLSEEPKPQPIEPLLSSSLTELGILPGSTLHFRRS
jgi:hypothetical protein